MKRIKDIPEHNRPREKLREKGAVALTDEELVAVILGRGVKGVDIVTMSRNVTKLIREHKKSLSLGHLTSVPGMGIAKAAQILSADSSNILGSNYSNSSINLILSGRFCCRLSSGKLFNPVDSRLQVGIFALRAPPGPAVLFSLVKLETAI